MRVSIREAGHDIFTYAFTFDWDHWPQLPSLYN